MPLRLLEAPTLEVVTLAEVKGHLRVDFEDDDADIEGFRRTAIEDLDGPEGALGRALAPQRWALELDRFPGLDKLQWRLPRRERHQRQIVVIPLPPLTSIDRVAYIAADGATVEMAEGVDYRVDLTDGAIEPLPDADWPETADQRAAVTIEFTCGYPADPADATRPTTPDGIRTAIRMMVADLYENRDSQVISESRATAIQNATVDRLLNRFFVRRA